eukprot:6014499-Prymnesium_polylepis.1
MPAATWTRRPAPLTSVAHLHPLRFGPLRTWKPPPRPLARTHPLDRDTSLSPPQAPLQPRDPNQPRTPPRR